jgi:hypothetical protein
MTVLPGRVRGDEGYTCGVKGDRVEVVVDAGDSIRVYDVRATRAGRRVEVTTGRGIVEVTEVTRGGTPVRTARFMTGRVIALVEHPAEPARKLASDAPDETDDQPLPGIASH